MRRWWLTCLVAVAGTACHEAVVTHNSAADADAADNTPGDDDSALPPDCSRDHGGCDFLTTCTMTDGLPVCGSCPTPYIGASETGCQCVVSSSHPGFEPRDPPTLPNIALGKTYTLSPSPNYSYCTEAGDATQLTDGVYTSGYFWTQTTTVGWTSEAPIIRLDLGSVRAIRGITFNTAAGVAGVTWPAHIYVLTADEDQQFHFAADLVELHERHAILPASGTYAVHKLWTDELVTHGRYVGLVIFNVPFAFVDEIEVFEGESSWIGTPLEGPGFTDLREASTQTAVSEGVRRRILTDMRAIVADAAAQGAPADLQQLLACELDSVAVAATLLPEPAADFRAELPLNTLHARVMSNQARLWQADGRAGIFAWPAVTWDRLLWREGPPAVSTGGLHVDLMRGEHRGVLLNMANAELRAKTVTLQIEGLPGGNNPTWISVSPVAWTDTWSMEPIAAALPGAELTQGSYLIDIPAGTTKQVWLDVHPQDVDAGSYDGHITIQGAQLISSLPLTVVVHPFDFPANPRLHVGGWDYTNGSGSLAVTLDNRAAFIAMLREHRVDTPWATTNVWPRGSFDGAGHLTTDPSTSQFDDWLGLWPNAGQYRIFAAVSDTIGGFAAGTAEFQTAVAEWAQFWSAQVALRGLTPADFGVLLVDEPYEAAQDATILAWATAIHASGAGFKVWEDITWSDPTQANADMVASCDTLCPNRQMFVNGSDAFRTFFRQQHAGGKGLELYSCSGPAHMLDPYAYHRLQAWTAWSEGATAMHYWAFGDTAGGSSWNEYALTGRPYTPLFLDDSSVVTGKHLEAIREGVEDFEYLAMLEQSIVLARGRGADAGLLSEAEALLTDAPRDVLVAAGTAIEWNEPLDRTLADNARTLILNMLDRLAP